MRFAYSSPDRAVEGLDLVDRGRAWVRAVPGAPGSRRGQHGKVRFGHTNIPQSRRSGESREALDLRGRIVGRTDRLAEAPHRLGGELGVEPQRRGEDDRV